MYASSGFSPKMRAGQKTGPTPGACETGISTPNNTSPKPLLNNAKVLVQMFLMMGHTPSSSIASAINAAPAITAVSAGDLKYPRVYAMPTSAPSSTLKQDGQVDRMPSGSKTTLPSTGQYWKEVCERR